MTTASNTLQASQTPSAARTGSGFTWADLWAAVQEWEIRHRTRATIEGLDERLLRDIGLTRDEALVEARKPFWLP